MFVYEYKKEDALKRYRKIMVIAGIILAVIILASIAVNIYIEVMQLDEIGGYSSIYLKNIAWKAIFALFVFIVVFASVAVTNVFIKRGAKKHFIDTGVHPQKLPNVLLALIAGTAGAILTKNAFFQNAILYFNSVMFNTTDPLFGSDISYYVFQRPLLMGVYNFIQSVALFIIIYTFAYYLYIFSKSSQSIFNDVIKSRHFVRHTIVNIAIYFGIKAFSYRFMKEGLLYSDFVGLKGAGYVDVNIWMRFYDIAPFILIAIVIASIFFLLRKQYKAAGLSIAVFPAVWLIVVLIAGIYHGLVVKPNEVNLESRYISYNMQMTRDAYDLNTISKQSLGDLQPLSPGIVSQNSATIDNIRVVDYYSTLISNIQLQSNTNFYTFNDGDIINYVINGKETPIFITAREIDKNRLPDKTYLNTTYKYTHGYGVVINPINRITPEGQVDFILSGLVMKSTDEKLKVNRPGIYYGELTNDHVVVNASGGLNEIDYDGNAETRYDGAGGIRMTFMNRLLFAIKYSDLNLVISAYPSGANLLLNRQIVERARKALPFLLIDSDPYIVLTDDGSLKWILDGYTTTDQYPYSMEYSGFNYIRNSAKIVIDAYDGKVECYIADTDDPIIMTFDKAYPGIISKEGLPVFVKEHMRYPEILFELQTEVMKRYHLDPTEAVQFYTKQDLWDIAKYSTGNSNDAQDEIDSYYNMIKLPGGIGTKEELILMRPFTPSGKNNMVSWLAVRNSHEDYGELILFSFPKNTNLFGPNQVEVKINQIDQVSKDMTLWGQSGSTVYKGSLLVIPIESSILYVQPIYIRASGTSSIPEVRKIVVGYQSGDEFKYGIGTNLRLALNDLFSTTGGGDQQEPDDGADGADGTDGGTDAGDMDDVLEDIMDKYDTIKKQLDELGKLIEQLK